ncbi:hypothetical protein GCM10027075_41040 [Streptomyces heilongjiangensis]
MAAGGVWAAAVRGVATVNVVNVVAAVARTTLVAAALNVRGLLLTCGGFLPERGQPWGARRTVLTRDARGS